MYIQCDPPTAPDTTRCRAPPLYTSLGPVYMPQHTCSMTPGVMLARGSASNELDAAAMKRVTWYWSASLIIFSSSSGLASGSLPVYLRLRE